MNIKLDSYEDLHKALSDLTPDQRKQKIRTTTSVFGAPEITELEVQSYDFLIHKTNGEDFGTAEELQRTHGKNFNINNYKIILPKGTILFN